MFHVAAVRPTGQDRAVPEYQEDRQQAYQDRLRATAEARHQVLQAGAAAILQVHHQAQAGHHPATAGARHQDPQAGAAAIPEEVQAGAAEAAIQVAAAAVPEVEGKK